VIGLNENEIRIDKVLQRSVSVVKISEDDGFSSSVDYDEAVVRKVRRVGDFDKGDREASHSNSLSRDRVQGRRVIPFGQTVRVVDLIDYPAMSVDTYVFSLKYTQRGVGHVVAVRVGDEHGVDLAVLPLVSRKNVAAFILPPYATVEEDRRPAVPERQTVTTTARTE
jgi:hypothetical protein